MPKPEPDDPMLARNTEVVAFAKANGLMTFKKEDHEVCVRLHGKNPGRYPSDAPQAGKWGPSLWYIYTPVPHGLTADHTATLGLESVPPVRENQRFFNERDLLRVLTRGPLFYRAKTARRTTSTGKVGVS